MKRDTSQNERMPAALSPEFFRLDNRSVADLVTETRQLAKALAFYNTSGTETPANWGPLFDEAAAFLEKPVPGRAGTCPPQLGLFLAFLKLFRHPRQQLNTLTASHLHFFYNRILQEEKKTAKPDSVYVFFELARNTRQFMLPAQSALSAGKDAQGNNLVYTTGRDAFLSQAKVTCSKATRTYKHPGGSVYAYPVANSTDGLGTPLETGQGWHPFGNHPSVAAAAKTGFGVSSPLLHAKEGIRTIEISLTLAGSGAMVPEKPDPAAFEAQFTGADGWFNKEVTGIRLEEKTLAFTVVLDVADPAVTAFSKDKHGYALYAVEHPLMVLIFKPGFTYSSYTFIQSLRIEQVTIRISVEKARALVVKNDFGTLDAAKAFQPFGYSPVKGSNLYLGLEETYSKPVDRFTIRMYWKGLPDSFKTHYEGYMGPTNSLVNKNEDFTVTVAIEKQGEWVPVDHGTGSSNQFPLFGERLDLAVKKQQIMGTTGLIRLTLASPAYAFGHALYPAVYARAIMSQLQQKTAPIPNEPYTPVMESIELGYTAAGDTTGFYHINPFGASPVRLPGSPLVSDELHQAGNLYLGFEQLHPPQQVAVFFNIQQEIPLDKPPPGFYCLTARGWKELTNSQLLSDTTLGLKQTGIITLNLPGDMETGGPVMPAGFHWLKITVPEDADHFDRVLEIRTNAVCCTAQQGHHHLPPSGITGFAKKIVEIKRVEQPYESFGGSPMEENAGYFTRVSEKLRHKMRCITPWDFERNILAQFPGIYKVRCLRHSDGQDAHYSPGSVHIIVIPFAKQSGQARMLKPMATNSTLTAIRRFAEGIASPNARIKVTNPEYEEIRIAARVSFNKQADVGYYVTQLQHDLQRFLSPWAFRHEAEIPLGSKLYRSSVVGFIESRPYISFIASISLSKNGRLWQQEEISSDSASVIVSAEWHDIEVAEAAHIVCQTNQGIEQMIVGINFEIQ